MAIDNPIAVDTSRKHWQTGEMVTDIGIIPQVSTRIDIKDWLGAIKVRLGLQRMDYTIEPGLYAVGSPSDKSHVFVSANYKLSFDNLRRGLEGINCWILVLDTNGINVWCAAGKGTFSANEIIHRIDVTRLSRLVSHRQIIVPQLGASGVAAHEVKRRSSFRVVYGPVRARDISDFLNAGMKTSLSMRQVNFNINDRLAVAPLELIQWGRYFFFIAIALFFLTGLNSTGYVFPGADGGREVLLLLIAFITNGIFVPMLLPWLPGRALSLKGMVMGLIIAAGLVIIGLIPSDGVAGKLEVAAWVLLIPTIGSFLAMNFTGSTPYTSLSGVKREMRFAVPLQIIFAITGLILWMVARFF